MLAFSNSGTLVNCHTQEQVELFSRLYALGYLGNELIYINTAHNIRTCEFPRSASCVEVYDMLLVDPFELYWQLPVMSPYDVTVFIDASHFSWITAPLLSNLTKYEQGVFQSNISTPDTAFIASELQSFSPSVMVFDKSQQTWDFFHCVKQILTNWNRFSVARLHPEHRKKRIEIVTSMAVEMVVGDNPYRLSDALPVANILASSTCLYHNGISIHPATVSV